ncbi:hypothetical protein [Agrobacterium tumefaciens]|uniref:hypothetical protein n=1 Tax=Agrobacterium tumefaciens TaxID=358 RepID=UPI00287C9814|nr:hypothetical protein [Agrobacterium tumefaciens]MDS7597516.1 hypothetical protein [Agrobacterium tumefaciens]
MHTTANQLGVFRLPALICHKRQTRISNSETPGNSALDCGKENVGAMPHPTIEGQNHDSHHGSRGNATESEFERTGEKRVHANNYIRHSLPREPIKYVPFRSTWAKLLGNV